MGDLKVAMCASTLGMDNSLRDSLSIELGEFVDQMEVLKQDGSSGSSCQ